MTSLSTRFLGHPRLRNPIFGKAGKRIAPLFCAGCKYSPHPLETAILAHAAGAKRFGRDSGGGPVSENLEAARTAADLNTRMS
jgi:hypothetical protein